MTQEQEILKIEIPVEDEAPFVPERSRPKVTTKAAQAGKTVAKATAQTAKNAWDSEPRRKVTQGVAKGATVVASKGGRFMRDKVAQTAERQARERAAAMRTRVQETDWKAEAKGRTSRGLNWLSNKLSDLATRLIQTEKNPPESSSG